MNERTNKFKHNMGQIMKENYMHHKHNITQLTLIVLVIFLTKDLQNFKVYV